MKTKINIIFMLTILTFCQIQAQKSAFEYLKQASKAPDSVCTCLKDVRQNFETSVRELADVVKEDAQKRKRANENYMDQNKDRMKAAMMKEMTEKSGMSQAELDALNSKKKMSKEDKQAMANKMLGQYGMTMDEVKNMKNMDKNAKKAWAEAYVTEQMAMAQANKGNPQAKAQSDKAMNNVQLLQEQEQLRSQISLFENDVQNRYNSLLQAAGKEKLNAGLEKLNNELQSIGTIYECNECPAPPKKDVQHWNAVIKKIQDLKTEYCRLNTPKFVAYLNWYKETLIKNIPVYDRAEEVQNLVTASTTNTQLSMPCKGFYALSALEGYLNKLENLFQFKIYEIENFKTEFLKF